MPTLPDWCSLLVRTDFTDDAAWDQAQEEATREYGPDEFCANVEPVSDPQWAGAVWEAVKAATNAWICGPATILSSYGSGSMSWPRPLRLHLPGGRPGLLADAGHPAGLAVN